MTLQDGDIRFECLIRHLDHDVYRICEHPILVEDQFLFGDCVRLRKIDEKSFEFLDVTSKSDLEFVQYIVGEPVAQDIEPILDQVSRANGYWQRDFGGVLSLYYNRTKFDPTSELDVVLAKHKSHKRSPVQPRA